VADDAELHRGLVADVADCEPSTCAPDLGLLRPAGMSLARAAQSHGHGHYVMWRLAEHGEAMGMHAGELRVAGQAVPLTAHLPRISRVSPAVMAMPRGARRPRVRFRICAAN